MYSVRHTALFRRWLTRLRDPTAKGRLIRRLERLADGNAGDNRYLGAALFELRENFGPGYRIYYTRRGADLILLLIGGDKSSQTRDILNCRKMIEQLEVTNEHRQT